MNVTLQRLSPSRFEHVIEKLKHILGDKNVVGERLQIKPYERDTTPVHSQPLAVVFPSNTEEVRQILLLANQLDFEIWPVSCGKNWGYGSAIPLRDNTVIVSLERLNKIISVNESLAYAVIEPGVTYAQLNSYMKEHGIKLWCDTTDGPPAGSVIGNALEKGIGETPYGDHFGNLCGMEVVLPDGNVVRTGGGPAENSQTWHTYKWGTGPYLEGLFCQSNLGIVTRAGIWLMPEPEKFMSYTFELADVQKFSNMIDITRDLALQGVVQTKLHIVNDVVALSLVSQYPQEALERGFLTSREHKQLTDKFGISCWSFSGGLYGSRHRVEADKKRLCQALSPLGKLTFIDDSRSHCLENLTRFVRKFPAESWASTAVSYLLRKIFGKTLDVLEAGPHIHSILKGNPTEFFVRHAYFKSPIKKPDSDVNPPRDECGLIWFAPIAPLASTNVNQLLALCRPLFEKHHFDFYVALLVTSSRSVVVLLSIFYRKHDPKEVQRANELYEELCAVTEPAGYQQYRTGLNYTERVLDCAPHFKKLANLLKMQLDPNNVISPGRYGLGTPSR